MNRRTLLAMTAVSALRVHGANDRIRVGLIGCGHRGRYLAGLFQESGAQVAAVCDVYETNLAAGRKLAPDGAASCGDYRRMLDDSSLDAVIIAAPDHWHARMMIDAAAAGKDAYLEKPIALQVDDGFRMVEAVRRALRVVQVGTQRRSNPLFGEAAGVLQSGAAGEIRLVNSWWYNTKAAVDSTPLSGRLDWDMWLGPAPKRDFQPARFNDWYYFRDYSGGMPSNVGAHIIDGIQMCMRSTYPLAVTCSAGRAHVDGAECPESITLAVEFPEDYLAVFTCSFRAMHYAFSNDQMNQFNGSKARFDLGREGYALYPQTDAREMKPSVEKSAPGSFEPSSHAHVRNFLDCVRSRKNPNATIEMGNYTSLVLAMASESLRTRRRIRWDNATKRMV